MPVPKKERITSDIIDHNVQCNNEGIQVYHG
jgi:hypothetical protein